MIKEIEDKESAMLADDLSTYIRDNHTQEECIGFISGYIAALNKLKKIFCINNDTRSQSIKTHIIPRGAGKTTNLIKKSAETGYYIVCHDFNEAYRIQQEARIMGLLIPFPITYDEFLKKGYYGKYVSGFLIDNADMLLQSLTKIPIKTITVSA